MGPTNPVLAQSTPESKGPVPGEYNGEWKGAPYAGSFYIKIEKLNGEEVTGTFYMTVSPPSSPTTNRLIPFVGKVDDARIKVTAGPLPLELAIEGQGREQFWTARLKGMTIVHATKDACDEEGPRS